MDDRIIFYAGLLAIVLGRIVWSHVVNGRTHGWADGRDEDRLRQRRHQERAVRNGIAPVTYGMVHPAPRRPPVCVDIETSFDDHDQTVVQYRRKRDHDGPGAA